MTKTHEQRCTSNPFLPGKHVWNDGNNTLPLEVLSSESGIRENDVVCGKKANSNPGNEKFRLLIQRNRQAYQSTSARDAKKKIIERIIEQVHASGGRFLKVEGEKILMEELSYDSCYEKVSHALRSARTPVSNVVRSKEEVYRGFGSLLELQKKLFQEYLEAEGLGLHDDVPSFKPRSSHPRADGSSIANCQKLMGGDTDLDHVGPEPFDLSRKHCLELDHEIQGFLVSL